LRRRRGATSAQARGHATLKASRQSYSVRDAVRAHEIVSSSPFRRPFGKAVGDFLVKVMFRSDLDFLFEPCAIAI